MTGKRIYLPGLFLFMIGILAGCSTANTERAEAPQTAFTLFSDVSHWSMPAWSLEEGSLTAGITERTGVTVDFLIPPQEADRQLSLMLADGRLPDIISVTDYTVIRQLISSGKVWRMDGLLKTYCPDSHLLKDFPEDIKNRLAEYFGGWYSYPSNIYSEDSRKTWQEKEGYYASRYQFQENTAIIWNKKLLEAAGLNEADLKTKSQVLAAFEQVKGRKLSVGGQEVVPLLLDGSQYQRFSLQYLNNSFGAEPIDENGNYRDIWRQPQARTTLSFLNQVFRNGYSKTEYLTYGNEQIQSLIAKNCVLCFIGNIANTGMDARDWVSTGAILPEDGSEPVVGIDLQTPLGWMQTLISKDCGDPAAAAQFLDYMTGNEGLLFTNFGIEGEDFYYDADGFVRRTALGEQKYQDKNQTGMGLWWNFVNDAWYCSVIPLPEPGSEEESRDAARTALGRESHVYDQSLLTVSNEFWESHKKEAECKAAIADFQAEQIKKIVTAQSDEEFEQEYQALLTGQEGLGLVWLDEQINSCVQENFKKYGKRIEKVN